MIRFKKIIFFLLLLMLFLPYIQKSTKLFKLKPLQGYFVYSTEPKFTYANWLSGKYQDSLNTFIEENIGLRPLLIRINNQIAFNISKIALANGVIVGKNNYLYEESYINSYLGRNFIGKGKIDTILTKALFLQKELKKKNIDLLLVYAPGKASYYPEYIPDKYNPSHKTISNYDYYVKRSKELSLNYIDFNKYFVEKKNSTKYPLYPKCGIHWSTYGTFIAIDSMINYIEKLRNIKMPEINLTGMEVTNSPRSSDNDIADGMNLVFNIPHPDLAYPKYTFISNSTSVKPLILSIADSYYWGILGADVMGNLFNINSTFWYYNQEIIPSDNPERKYVFQINQKEEVEKRDLIMILYTEANLNKFSNNFIDEMYEIYSINNPNAPYHNSLDSIIEFNYINQAYVTKEKVNDTIYYKVKTGAPASTLFLQCDNFILKPDVQYKVTFKAKGFKSIQLDVYPDNYPRFSTIDIKSNEFRKFQWIIQLNKLQNGSSFRVFMDEQPTLTEDLILSEFKLIKL